VFETRDFGKTWRVVDGPHAAGRVRHLLGRPDRPDAVTVLGEWDGQNGAHPLYVRNDDGETWAIRSLPRTSHAAVSIAGNPVAPDMLAVGTGSGAVIVTFDEGRTWHDYRAGLPNGSMVTRLAFSPADNRLYAFLRHSGLYWIELPGKE